MYTLTVAFLILCLSIYKISGEVCLLRETSRYPWLVKIWKPASAKIVGHGALLSEDKVLSSCNAFATLSQDLANERYEMIVADFGGVDRQISFCTDSRFANSIMLHPECDPSSPSQLHDLAMWNLERPFQVVGKPFLTSLLLEKEVIEVHVSEVGLNEPCRMVFAKDPTKMDLFGTEEFVGRCGFQDYTSLDVCEPRNCTQQLADGLLCFYDRKKSADSWKVRQPLETPDFVEGSVVLCFGHPVGIASRTFHSNDNKIYRMFSNLANNLDFLNVSWTPSTTISTTPMTTNKTTTTRTAMKSTTGGERTPHTRKTTPINCKCPSYNESINNFDGQTSIHIDHFGCVLIALVLHSILQNFGRT